MAGKPKDMNKIKQLLILYQQNYGYKKIAKILGISKNTVKNYHARIKATQMSPKELLALETPVLEAKLLAGNPSFKDSRYEVLKGNLHYYLAELKKTGVTRKLLWEEYKASSPHGYSYTQFCYHLKQLMIAADPTMVLTHQPGEKLYIDFAGKTLSYIDRSTGEIIPCQVFIACLPYSDYCFVKAVASQCTEDFINALVSCFNFLGGVPYTLVPDNLKAAVIKAHNYEPHINQALTELANHYNCSVLPTRVGKPQDKALVENQVQLVYSRVYAKLRNQYFFDQVSLNRGIIHYTQALNQTRMQQKPYCREELFLAEEHPVLLPLPKEDFQLKYSKDLKVSKNNHIYLSPDKHYYSVPYHYIGKRARVIFTRKIVDIFIDGNKVASHLRDTTPGSYTTLKEHLCSTHQHYLDRSPGYYKNRAIACNEVFYKLITRIFEQKHKYPEQLYRTCDGLFSLQRKSQETEFIAACQIALTYQNYSYGFIAKILDNNMTQNPDEVTGKSLPNHANTRGPDYFK